MSQEFLSQREQLLAHVLILAVVFAALLTSSEFVPTNTGNLLLALAAGVFSLYYYYIYYPEIRFSRLPGLLLSVIIGVYAVAFILGDYGLFPLIRVFAFLLMGYSCIFFIPALISEQDFLRYTSFILTVPVIFGLISYFIGSISLPWYEITTVDYNHPRYFLAGETHQVQAVESIFTNQNTFGPVAFFAAIFSISIFYNSRQKIYLILFVLNFIGVYLSRSRAAMLAFIAAISVLVLYHFDNQKLLSTVSILLLPSILLVTAIGSGLLPDPLFFRDILGARHRLWTASVDAIAEYGLLGTGPVPSDEAISQFLPAHAVNHPHNAFLRVFVTGGVIAGVAYVSLFALALLAQVRQQSRVHSGIVATFVGVCVLQLFEAWLVFGMTLMSVISAVVLGFLFLRDSDSQTAEIDR